MLRKLAIGGVLVLLLGLVLDRVTQPSLEGLSQTEAADIEAIVAGILKLQASDAAGQHRPLARGTHAKGVCARAEFDVLDLKATVPDGALASRLARGLYAVPAKYPGHAPVRQRRLQHQPRRQVRRPRAVVRRRAHGRSALRTSPPTICRRSRSTTRTRSRPRSRS